MQTRTIAIFFGIISCVASSAAQVLTDFGNFAVDTYFQGTWTQDAAQFTPAATFSQGAGVYNIQGVTNSLDGVASHYYQDVSFNPVPLDLGSNRQVELNAMALPGNVATSLIVTIFDDANRSAAATLDFATISSSSFNSYSAAFLSASPSFNWSAIVSFDLSGSLQTGASPLAISMDSLTAVPEPATYAALLGLVTLGLVGYRRFRRS